MENITYIEKAIRALEELSIAANRAGVELRRGKGALTAQSIAEFTEKTRPKITFEVDEKTLREIHRLSDDNGQFLWAADLRGWCKNGTIMGHKVVLADDPTFQIRYEFADGSSHVVKYDSKGE